MFENPNKYLDSDTWDALKAAGFTEPELYEDQPMGPIIHGYSRAQAIADGTLIDLTQGDVGTLCRQAGIRCPIAMTSGAFAATVYAQGVPLPPGQDLAGRLWDVLMVFRYAARQARDTDRVHFSVRVFDGHKHDEVCLWSLIGPGDDAEPVITIILEGED